MKKKRWRYVQNADVSTVQRIANELSIDPSLSEILVSRGVDTFEKAKEFFTPSFESLHDPFLMKDMDKAIARIELAIENGQKILIYGDYDVDGTTAVAVFFSFLRKIYAQVGYYIPDRQKEGYGISTQGIDFASEVGYSLIVALDCGIKSVDKVEYAKSLNIDFIICDHHTPGPILPSASAILNPKQENCTYPFKELCGCAVGFKLIQGWFKKQGWDQTKVLQYLDLVAIGTAADIVPMVGENRVLTHLGLTLLNSYELRPGLKPLFGAGVKKQLSVSDLVFTVAPRINAAGRMASGNEAVKLLICNNDEESEVLCEKINLNNALRKDHDSSTTLEALQMILDNNQTEAKTTVVYNENWHKGVVGIVASRLIETYYRPTIVLTRSGEQVTGSARSVSNYNVYDAIEKCSPYLEQFGGHMFAAGLTMAVDKVEVFRESFEKAVSENITDEQLCPEIIIDQVLNFNQITPKFCRILKRMGPFGPHNMEPVFSTIVELERGVRVLNDSHLKMVVKQNSCPALFDAIGFKMIQFHKEIEKKGRFEITYCIQENEFRGKITLQLLLKDIRFPEITD